MKKVFTILLSLLLLASLTVPVFAQASPEGDELYKVVFVKNAEDKTGYVYNVKEGGTLEFKADPNEGKFDGWNIYKMDGTPATVNVDYTVVRTASLAESDVLGAYIPADGETRVLGSYMLTAEVIELKPLNNLIITANYNGIITEPVLSTGEDTAPETGDATIVTLALVALVALCGAAVAKKAAGKINR